MDKETRNLIQRATQRARHLIEVDFQKQLEGTFDIRLDGAVAAEPGAHLDAEQRLARTKLVAAVEHLRSGGLNNAEAVAAYLREAAFTTLNRFVALKMLEARGLVQECISRVEQSSGFKEFSGLAPGLVQLPDHGYRLYIESLFDEIGREVRVLFDRRDPAGLLWPRRQALVDLFTILNAPELSEVWSQDETIGWVYQYFNGDEERRQMRAESQAPRNSRELAVRNQFFTPRYVVEFLTDNTLGRIWYDMRQGKTLLAEQCDYLVRRPVEVFLRTDHVEHFAQCHQGVRDSLNSGDFSQLPVELGWDDLEVLALGINGYEEASRLGFGDCGDLANETLRRFREQGVWEGDAAHLWCCLFFEQRRWRHFGEEPQDQNLREIAGLYGKLREELQKDISELSQEELLRRPVFIRPREKKDPRDIRILDPACGSGHFLLYAFDLLITMYEEAWQDDDFPRSEVTGRTLREDHAAVEELRLAIPDLILRHNLHGIDIDPRAAQIAALALWMRSQRAYNDYGISRSDRPRISKTNIVVAEPMPGERDLLEEFVAPLDNRLGALVKRVFEKMELAGEAGSLLRIEEEIRAAVREVYTGIGGIFQGTDEQGWFDAEEQLLCALRRYAEHARNGSAYRRRLFAEDAERGLGFIDLCRQRYDAVVMNPPFGDAPGAAKSYVESRYPNSRQDLFASFVERSLMDFVPYGAVGVISTEAGFFRRTLEPWRREILLKRSTIGVLAHLGGHVLDGATVRTACYAMVTPHRRMDSLFIRVQGQGDREKRLLEAIENLTQRADSPAVFATPQGEFEKLPYAVFGYWCSAELRNAFIELPKLEESAGHVRVGLQTSDDVRFLRLRWEVPAQNLGEHYWIPFAKGGEYSPFHDDVHLVLNWGNRGKELVAWGQGRPQNTEFFGKSGITYPRRTNKRFAPRALPAGCAFGDKGPAIVEVHGSNYALLALLNSRPVSYLLSLALGTAEAEGGAGANSYEVGLVQRLPVPPGATNDDQLSDLARRAWSTRADSDFRDETTSLFHSPVAPMVLADTIEECAGTLARRLGSLVEEYVRLQRAIDLRVSALYRLSPSDWDDIEAQVGDVHIPTVPVDIAPSFRADLAAGIVQFLIGCAFGRWEPRDLRWEGPNIEEVDPFATAIPREDIDSSRVHILTDDPGHSDDIVSAVNEALLRAGLPESDQLLVEAARYLEASEGDIRYWIRKLFFDQHIKHYSKSRRKAPIYWQLATASASYSVWLYYHRLTKDTFYKVLNDYVTPKLQYEERKLTSFMQTAGPNPDAGQRKEMAEQETFVQELRAFREEVARIAPLWNPDLNDGVIINFAPLWRLVPQHRALQKECKDCWDKLVAGDYDWSHLAMNLCPERGGPEMRQRPEPRYSPRTRRSLLGRDAGG